MSKPDEEPTDKPASSREEAAEDSEWMFRNWIGVAVVSIAILLLITVGLMQGTGLIDVFAPVADSETGQWGAFAVLALIVAALAAWGWKSLLASDR